ncbi:MAG: hypothetical protein HOO06_14820 [Bdellovibrionaceae bacterium]|jgi:hypothetical protein|nr:hypothetical protein [Pseudobdellovibrionaceae bacterium]
MPGYLKQKQTKVIYTSLVGFALFSFTAMSFLKSTLVEKPAHKNNRKIASTHKYNFIKGPLIHSTQKLSGPIQVHFNLDQEDSIISGEPFTLLLNITSQIPISEAKIQWNIPSELELLSGVLEDRITLNSNEPYVIELTLQSQEEINYQIHAMVSSGDEKLSFTKTAQFNTLKHKQLKSKLEALKATNEQYIKNQKQFKFFQ